jgi:hypothetical protein
LVLRLEKHSSGTKALADFTAFSARLMFNPPGLNRLDETPMRPGAVTGPVGRLFMGRFRWHFGNFTGFIAVEEAWRGADF